MGRGCLIAPSQSVFRLACSFSILALHVSDFRADARPHRVITRLYFTYFFSFIRTGYCLAYPDIRSPKIHSSPSVRPLRDERFGWETLHQR